MCNLCVFLCVCLCWGVVGGFFGVPSRFKTGSFVDLKLACRGKDCVFSSLLADGTVGVSRRRMRNEFKNQRIAEVVIPTGVMGGKTRARAHTCIFMHPIVCKWIKGFELDRPGSLMNH